MPASTMGGGGGGGRGGGDHHSPTSGKTPRGDYSALATSTPTKQSPRWPSPSAAASSVLPSGAAALLESRWALPAAFGVFLFLAVTLAVATSSLSVAASLPAFFPAAKQPLPLPPPSPPPGAGVARLAYLVSGSKGDLDRLWRTLHALYHPRNLYVVHLDREAAVSERLELAARVANSSMFRRVGNVEVIRRSNMVTYRGPTMVANTLHACAVLLRRSRDWDWFINLSASDYPLMTQDGTTTVPLTLSH
jgi:hypothetical protein